MLPGGLVLTRHGAPLRAGGPPWPHHRWAQARPRAALLIQLCLTSVRTAGCSGVCPACVWPASQTGCPLVRGRGKKGGASQERGSQSVSPFQGLRRHLAHVVSSLFHVDCSAEDRGNCPVSPKNSSMTTASVPGELRQDWSHISRGVRSLEIPLAHIRGETESPVAGACVSEASVPEGGLGGSPLGAPWGAGGRGRVEGGEGVLKPHDAASLPGLLPSERGAFPPGEGEAWASRGFLPKWPPF